MNNIYIKKEISDYHINDDDIRNIEKLKSCILPADYKEFLLKYNGGTPNFNAFTIEKEEGSTIRFFFGIDNNISSKRNYDIIKNIKQSKDRIPEELLPIACDSFGNRVCIGVKDKHYGKIYFWDHENEAGSRNPLDNTIKPWWKNITLIANSFTDLLNSLCKYELGDNDESILTYQDGSVKII